MKRVAIIGGGKVGRTLGWLLRRAGYDIEGVVSKSRSSARKAVAFIGGGEPATKAEIAVRGADIVFLTTPDDVIKKVCDSIAKKGGFRRNGLVLHCCGSASSEELLSSARRKGAYITSIHPLKSFADPHSAIKNFRGTFCIYEGNKPALPLVRRIIRDIGGIGLQSDGGRKALYHAGAVFSSNYVVTLLEIGIRLFESAGVSRKDAISSLFPLLKGTVGNIEKVGIPKALTGPIERGDVSNVEKHLKALNKHNPRLAKIYSLLGNIAVDIAISKESITTNRGLKLRGLLKKFAK